MNFCVHLNDFDVQNPAKEVDQMDGMIHHGAAPSQRAIAKPLTMRRWYFTMIDAIDPKNPPKVSLLHYFPQRDSRGSKAHREGSHKVRSMLNANVAHRFRISQICRNWLLTENMDPGN